MYTTVVKFGGSSLADANQFRKVADIIHSDSARRYVVVSAPGKRDSSDTKVTDLLYRCYNQASTGDDFSETLNAIKARYAGIIGELQLNYDITPEIESIRTHLQTAPQKDYMASRGEYLNGRLMAAYLGYPFVDPADCVRFREDGSFEPEATYPLLSAKLLPLEHAVIAGFYGAQADGTIRTFSRGGSDITGSIVARAVTADLYENWTDVSGMLAADPRLVDHPREIDYISYQELRELSYMGASVMHEDAVFPVSKAGIPINIRNTNRPGDPGTMIVASLPRAMKPRTVTGVAGRKGFCSIQVEKSMMNSEIGFGAKLLQIIADYNISFEHCPSGIDTMSVIIESSQFAPHRNEVLRDIHEKLHPDVVIVEDDLAIIAVVGHGMAYSKGVAARIFRAIADAGVNIRMIDQGSSELNIIVAVDGNDYEAVIRAIYNAVI